MAGAGGLAIPLASDATGSFPTLRDCVFENNVGGLSAQQANVTLERVVFRANTGWGASFQESLSTFRDVDFLDTEGSGLVVSYAARVNWEGGRLQGNRAARGAGIHIFAGGCCSGSVYGRDLVFEDNVATEAGGGAWVGGDLAYFSASNVTFLRNRTEVDGAGGGLYVEDGTALLANVSFLGNAADTAGGGAFIHKDLSAPFSTGLLLLSNARLVGNTASQGGGIYAAGSLQLYNGTLVANEASDGAAIASAEEGASVHLNNTILWGHGDLPIWNDGFGDAPVVNHALVEGGYADGTMIFDADPQFLSLPSPGTDGLWGSPDDDYGTTELTWTSPAINVGDDALLPSDHTDLDDDGNTSEPLPLDLAGEARILGPPVDLGAYENPLIVANESSDVPLQVITLHGAHPNPSLSDVRIRFDLHAAATISLIVFDVLGRQIAESPPQPFLAGFDRTFAIEEELTPGVYLYHLCVATEATQQTVTGRFTRLR